jgi:hypothetical protein
MFLHLPRGRFLFSSISGFHVTAYLHAVLLAVRFYKPDIVSVAIVLTIIYTQLRPKGMVRLACLLFENNSQRPEIQGNSIVWHQLRTTVETWGNKN